MMKILHQDSRSPSRDSKMGPPEYEAGVLANRWSTMFGGIQIDPEKVRRVDRLWIILNYHRMIVMAGLVLAVLWWLSSGMLRRIASVNFYQTKQRNIPEDSHLHTRLLENLKFHLAVLYFRVLLLSVVYWLES
jgi:hypothetical protein